MNTTRRHRMRRAAAGLLAATGLLLAATLPVAAASGQPAPVPMLVYGTVQASASGGAPPASGSVQAWVGGTAAGLLALSGDGSFGSAADSEYLVVQGSSADTGQPVTFTVNGVAAAAAVGTCANGSDAGPGVTWAPSLICSVTLTVPGTASTAGLHAAGTLPAAEVGQDYAQQLGVSGGTPPYTWSLDPNSDPLPAGLSLSSGGLLGGTPTTAGLAAFTLDVADSGHPAIAAAVPAVLIVAPAGVTIAATSAGSTTSDSAPARAGGAGSGTPDTSASGSGGTGSVLTAGYASDPEPSPAPGGSSGTAYFDIGVTAGSAFASVTVQRCGLSATAELYWWDATTTAWTAVSPQTPPDAGGCITVTFDATSSPSLAQLSGTPFAAVGLAPASSSTGTVSSGSGSPAAPAPVVTAVSPTSGAPGTVVTVTGSGFTGATAVRFGTEPAAGFTVLSDRQLTAPAPTGRGRVDISVVTKSGTSAPDAADRFTYTPTVGAVQPTAPAAFSDVPATYWAHGAIEALAGAGIAAGFPGGTFQPDAEVTRAQFIKMLDLTLGIQPVAATTPFDDVPAAAWFAPYVAAALRADIAAGTSATTFSPNATLTREAMAVLLARALKLSATVPLSFRDAARIDAWALQGVREAVAAGYIAGFPGGAFEPQAGTTRAQAAKVLALVLGRQGSGSAGSSAGAGGTSGG